jgi:hypothetical protein
VSDVTVWLGKICDVLDDVQRPTQFFFRDDDAGWRDDRLFSLLDIFERHRVPIDLAAIPLAVSASGAKEIRSRMSAEPKLVRVHQHGYAHANHESSGKKCEFGLSRSRAEQKADIAAGQKQMLELFGSSVEKIFTPPWNRCTAYTAECLVEQGFEVLSRESEATLFGKAGLAEVPIDVDWFPVKRRERFTRDAWAGWVGAKIRAESRVGVMFHHAVMEAEDLMEAGPLLAMLASHPAVRFATIGSVRDVRMSGANAPAHAREAAPPRAKNSKMGP